MASSTGHTTAAPRELVFSRIFDAPRALMWTAWTDPAHVARWWGPNGVTNPVCALDLRPGGAIRVDMRGADGSVSSMTGVFHDIVEPERLVFTTNAFADAEGHPQLAVLNTVTFAEHDGKTTVTLHAVIVTSSPTVAASVAGMEEGWTQSLDRLADYLGYVQGEER